MLLKNSSQAAEHHFLGSFVLRIPRQLDKRLIDEHDHAQLIWDHHQMKRYITDDLPCLVDILNLVVEVFNHLKLIMLLYCREKSPSNRFGEVYIIVKESLLKLSDVHSASSHLHEVWTLQSKAWCVKFDTLTSIDRANSLLLEHLMKHFDLLWPVLLLNFNMTDGTSRLFFNHTLQHEELGKLCVLFINVLTVR